MRLLKLRLVGLDRIDAMTAPHQLAIAERPTAQPLTLGLDPTQLPVKPRDPIPLKPEPGDVRSQVSGPIGQL
jgi:hypothetical protein